MNPVIIWQIAKKLLPTKKISAYILGVLAALLAVLMGVNSVELKEQFCANAPIEFPKVEAPAEQPK